MAVTSCPESTRTLRFDRFEMDLITRQLHKNGHKVKLQDQPFRILEHLALQAKEPVLREELYSYLPAHSTYDSKHGLNNAIRRIRKALHDSADSPRFVETLHGRGYRFLRDVEFIPCAGPSLISLPPDSFLSALKQLRGEFLATNVPQELSGLFHRLTALLDQHREHPNRSEGFVLLEAIHAARSQHNVLKHKVSFESAALVFEDSQALSKSFVQDVATWHTLGRVPGGVRTLGRPVVLLVSHQIEQNKNWILSARKATPIERAVYDQTRKKTD